MKEVFDPLVQVVGIDNDGVGTRRDQTPDHDIQQGLPVQREQRFGGMVTIRA
jgi:hypothetical protein